MGVVSSVVECLPATQEARVRFLDDAILFCTERNNCSRISSIFYIKYKIQDNQRTTLVAEKYIHILVNESKFYSKMIF